MNRINTHSDPNRCIHHEIEQTASAVPERTALIFRDRSITYAQLIEQSERLASYLRTRGIQPDQPVAIGLEQSLESVIAIVGVLRAGGAYLPLDPGFPAERIGFMLADSEARIILTRCELRGLFSSDARIICLDTDWDAIVSAAAADGPAAVLGRNLAYLMYTSGSTGRPKGVMVEHRNVLSFFAAMDQIIGNDGSGKWLALTSISFDISVLELLWTLARGFTVVIQPDHGKIDLTGDDSIPAQIAHHRITHLQCTPAHAQMITRSPSALSKLESIRVWMIGGEVFPPALARELHAGIKARILNMYGPTETTVWSACHEVVGDEQVIPIGRPIDNTQIYILDTATEPVSAGAVGEIYIGGAGVARGYWKRAELTAERFVQDLFADSANARLYKTGDLGRYRADGAIEFLGRTDFQVKLRGFRIELGEIEAVLAANPGVRDVVVVTDQNGAGEAQLIACVVAHSEQALSAAELRIYARQKLPAYMLPNRFVFVDEMPLTPNGKVDRKALSAAYGAGTRTVPATITAMTDLENTIAAVWQELLSLDGVNLNGNFFELGATSLTVAEAASRLREKLNREIRLTDLFRFPTVSALAAYLAGAESSHDAQIESPRGAARRRAIAERIPRRRGAV